MRSLRAAERYKGDLSRFVRAYEYQPELTTIVDRHAAAPWTQERVNEIVLWKVNRYVRLSSYVLRSLNAVRRLHPREHRQAAPLLATLLRTHGIDLAMASTLLRFRNPEVFQIIDRRAYRAVFGKPYRLYFATPDATKQKTFFEYIDRLHELAESRNLPFRDMDRILYVFDKRMNGPL